ncbi:hypothetical protein [Methanosphaerula subterraneus]|uniref:hypothetical protein n=1 Tax=Methanosphaerula subterraneus TaxID=3350244 RepID=UPI003F85C89B
MTWTGAIWEVPYNYACYYIPVAISELGSRDVVTTAENHFQPAVGTCSMVKAVLGELY